MILFLGVLLALTSTATANICQGLTDNSFVANPADCQAWFRCSPTGPVAGRCPDPFLFNPQIRECDWKDNFECQFQCPVTPAFIDIPVNGSCTDFIRCLSGSGTLETCATGLHFNRATARCDLPENANCTVASTCPPNIPPGQLIANRDPADCSVYWTCVTGQTEPTRRECNPALHFDPVTQQCTHPNLTDCPIQETTTTTTTGQPGNPEDPEDPGHEDFVCPSDGHHPSARSCSNFFICAGGVAHPMSCSAGLHFNRSTNQCDLPQNANCTVRR